MRIKASKIIRGIAKPVIWYGLCLLAAILACIALMPFLGSWALPAAELLVQLPVTWLTYRHLRRKQGTSTMKLPHRTTAVVIMLFVLAASIPSQLVVRAAATGGPSSSDQTVDLLRTFVVAAVMEKMVFHGAIFPMAHTYLGFWPALIVDAVLFQSDHGLAVLPVTLVLPLASTAVYDATGNIRYSMLLHLVHNLVSVLAVGFAPSLPWIVALPVYFIGLAIVIVCCHKRDKIISRTEVM